MKRFWLLTLVVGAVVAAGCAGNSDSKLAGSRFPGTYTGTWENLADGSDAGTSNWTIDANGHVEGTDTDPGRATTFHVVGTIDAAGNLTTTSTPVPANGIDPAPLSGHLMIDDASQLTGTLVWGVDPAPLSYRYTFVKTH